jgi:hypothetical protein
MDTYAPALYRIQIKGLLDGDWADWFDGMTISPHHERDDETCLEGYVADQAALHGILFKIRDLNLVLISIHRVTDDNHAASLAPKNQRG